MNQKELITLISKETGVSKTWMAKLLNKSRQHFNQDLNKNNLNQDQIDYIKISINYGAKKIK